ncbi:MAG: hydrogenase-4 component G [Campylobacterales bacterium]|nr:hydrogenase-4 component G [Campylobacterales bacterium]
MDIKNSTQGSFGYNVNASYQKMQFQGGLKIGGEKINADILVESYALQFQMDSQSNSVNNMAYQGGLFDITQGVDIKKLEGLIDYNAIGYSGKPLSQINTDEAKALVADDGFFGIEQTSKRLADFVIQGSGGDLNLLKAGKEGILQGFKEAEEMFGGRLFDISYKTIEKAVETIDKFIEQQGGNILDTKA